MTPNAIAFTSILAGLLACMAGAWPALAQEAPAQHSALWGERGELWSPHSRLPDFSFAGYHQGERELPTVQPAANVRDFGAVGDGQTDDSQAFLDAIAATNAGAILIPPGRYLIRQIIRIDKPNIVLRGAGPDRTILTFDRPLETIKPNMGATTGNRPTSNYSWSGGFIWIQGRYNQPHPRPVVANARRGDHTLTVRDTDHLRPGQRVMLQITDDEHKSLLDHLYQGQSDSTDAITRAVRIRMVSRIESIDGNRVTLQRPLMFDVRTEWSPTLSLFEPTVTESGIEHLAFEFPNEPYKGHFTELGYNAIAINSAADCWVRDVRIRNADSGIFLSGMFNSAIGIVIESERTPFRGDTGHHGITMGNDCLLDDFDIGTSFIHDITVSNGASGNVVKNGRGVNLAFDHHKRYPFANLFTNIDVVDGEQMWRCGGGARLGRHTAAWATFWCIRSQRDQSWPRQSFGPDMMNLVGIQTSDPSTTDVDGRWFEAIPPDALEPKDLHAAQLEARLRGSAQ